MPTPTVAMHTNAEPNITPMLDVLLVLLIIFMSVVVQVHHTVDVNLPVPDPCTAECGGDAIVLEVRPGPEYRINRTVVPNELLSARLKQIYEGRPSKILQLAGYPGATYQQVVHAIDVARGAGIHAVAITPRDSYLPH